ncbi:MAG: M4 family peptidase, partial [Pedosphaera sp.]|nr:M4 family peptidase [Pedosphaera sp.]
MKHPAHRNSPVPTKFKVLLLSLCAIAWSNTSASAQASQSKAIAASLQPAPTVWGEVRTGTASRTESDPRVRAIADKLAIPAIAARQPALVAAPGPGVAAAQQAALQLLRANSGPNVKVHFRAANQTIAQIRGGVLARPAGGVAKAGEGAAGERTARSFLKANAALLRLDDPDKELKLEVERRDDAGERHLKFTQVFKDVPVWPAGLSVHLDAAGNVNMVDGAYAPTPGEIAVLPGLSAEEARQRAAAGVSGVGGSTTGEPELVVYAPLDRAPRLAWKLNVSRDIAHAWLVIVDAQDGRVLNRTTLCYDANVAQSARGLDNVNRNVNAWSQDGKFYLADTTKKMFNAAVNPIKDPRGVITILDAREVTIKDLKTAFIVESADGVNWLPDGISALYNFSQTYDYFLERHDRNSLDGKGGNIDAIVRVKDLDNAFWNGNLKIMVFGNAKPYPLALDVVGHELTHGVTENSANLIYELQPGAMNEAFSDIFGTMVEARVTGQVNWTLGEQLGKIFRDLKNPGSLQISGLNRPYPSKMSEYVDLPNSDDADHGGVHINSSIINHAFYMLAEGLPQAVGLRDAEKIFYRCLTVHLQTQSQFIDARLGCITSAEALFGPESTQARKTADAFDAVEIFATPATPAPAPIPAVSGEDSTVFVAVNPFTSNLALGRRETSLGDPNDGVALADGIKQARPSVSGDGSLAVLVSANNDVCIIDTANPVNQLCVGVAGLVHSAAISPDGGQIAFILRDAL